MEFRPDFPTKDFYIQHKDVARKGNLFNFQKYAGKSVLRYELGVDILAGNSAWVKGLYPAGARPKVFFLTVFYRTVLSQASALRLTTATWGMPKRSSAPITAATGWTTLGCRVRQGLTPRRSTGALKTGASWRRCTAMTSQHMGWFLRVCGDHPACHHERRAPAPY
jgi:hypothetical protein